jgi:hypothetical protein
MDSEGAFWVQTADTQAHTGRNDSPGGAVVSIREGGEVLNRIEHDRPIFGCALAAQIARPCFYLRRNGAAPIR